VEGINDASLIANGTLAGQRSDDFHAVGLTPMVDGMPAPGDVINMVETRSYNNAGGPLGPDDVAGALARELGDIGVENTVTFTFHKSVSPVPEPGTFLLLGLGGILFLLRRRGR